MNLFQLDDAYEQVLDNDELDFQTQSDTLDAIKDARDVKVENIAKMVDRVSGRVDQLKDKEKSYHEERVHLENKKKFLIQYLSDYFDENEIKKLETDNHIISIRNFKASTVITDEDKIPAKYRNYAKYEGRYDVMKQDIYKDLKDGKDVPGARLEPNRKVVIK